MAARWFRNLADRRRQSPPGAADKKSIDKIRKAVDRVVKLCSNPRMNLRSSPVLPDSLRDITRLIDEILSEYVDNLEFLNGNEYFKTFVENVQDKCLLTIRLFKDAKNQIYDDTSSFRRSFTKLSLIFHYALCELNAIFPNGVYCDHFVVTDTDAADFWLTTFQTRTIVPWRGFRQALSEVHPLRSSLEAMCMKSTIDLTCNDHISIFEFDVFCRLYQPWKTLLQNWNTLAVTHPGYCAFFTSDEVTQKLQPYTYRPGVYVYHLSHSKLGYWAIGHVTFEGKIDYTIIQEKSFVQALVDGFKEGIYLYPNDEDRNPDLTDLFNNMYCAPSEGFLPPSNFEEIYDYSMQREFELFSRVKGLSTPGKEVDDPNYCIALCNFRAEYPSRLSIKAEEILEVLEWDRDDGWCQGRNKDGKEGFFPRHYVQPLKCVALHNYKNEYPTGIDLVANEILDVLEWTSEDGWCLGRNANGKKGYFPQSYVQPLKVKDADKLNEYHKTVTLPELSAKESYACVGRSSLCLVYVPGGIKKISIEVINDIELHPKLLQANEILITSVVCVHPRGILFTSSKPAIIELLKTVELTNQNPNQTLVPLFSSSDDPLEWKDLPMHDCEMLEDRVTFKTTQLSYFAVIARFMFPSAKIAVEPNLSQAATLNIPELPGFEMEIPPTSIQSNIEITATVLYDDQRLHDDKCSQHSLAASCIALQPHNAHFSERITVTIPIPNYREIIQEYPDIKLELWHAPVTREDDMHIKWKIIEDSDVTIIHDGDNNWLATAQISHFSWFKYIWNSSVEYCLNFFANSVHGRCQVFMSREIKHGSLITFGVAVLLYPFQNPYKTLQNYDYLLYDSELPIELVAGKVECRIELDSLVFNCQSASQLCYKRCCRFSKDFSTRADFSVKIDGGTKSHLPEGILGALFIDHGPDDIEPHEFSLIKRSTQNLAVETSADPEPPVSPHLDECDILSNSIGNAACQLFKTTEKMKENVMAKAAGRIAEYIKEMSQLACNAIKSVDEGSKDDLVRISTQITSESEEIDKIARKVASACTEQRLSKAVLDVVDKIPVIANQLKILSEGTKKKLYCDKASEQAAEMLAHNAKNLVSAIEDVLYASEGAVIKLSPSKLEELNLISRTTLSSVPELHQLDLIEGNNKTMKVIERMAHKWEQVATRLYFGAHDIISIQRDCHHQTLQASRRVIMDWQMGKGRKPITWATLIKALSEADLAEVSRDLESIIGCQ